MTLNQYTDISITNQALSKIGEMTISSFEENSDLAGLCSRLYSVTRDHCLTIHPWNFCRAQRQLAKSQDVTPINGWAYAYRIPTDALSAPSAVFGDGSLRPVTGFEVFGVYIYTNYETVIIDYVRRPPVENWPPFFIAFFDEALAAEFAMPITNQASKAAFHHDRAWGANYDGGLFAAAKARDAQGQPIQSFFDNGNILIGVR